MTTKSTTADRPRASAEPGTLVLLCLAAWIIPGAGHFWMGRRQKAIVFVLALPAMFLIGLLLKGRVFPSNFPSRSWASPPSPTARGDPLFSRGCSKPARRPGHRRNLRVPATVT